MKKVNQLLKISLAMLLLASCSNEKKESKSTAVSPVKIDKVEGIARIEPEQGLLYIYSSANGTIENVNTSVNDKVKEGNVLINLENSTDIAQLNMEESKISSQKSTIQSAEMNANATLTDLKKAERDVSLNEQLFAAKAITEQTLNNSKAQVNKLQLDYKKLLSDKELAKNKLVEINAGIQYQKAVVGLKQIRAPYDGKVLQWDVHKGDYVTTGQKLGQFAPDGALIAKAEIDELFAGRIKTGMKAEIISQLNGEKIADGEVIFVGGYLKKKSLFSDENTVEDRRIKEVFVRLNTESKTTINSRVNCIIFLNK
jgi:HlyD family secretion protein